jgi:hypothetical protein
MDLSQYRREASYYSFINRSTATVTGSRNVGAGFVSIVGAASIQDKFQVAVDQAVKLVSVDLILTTPNPTGLLVNTSASFAIENGDGTEARNYPLLKFQQPVGEFNVYHVADDEWFFWNDYTEQGHNGLAGDFRIIFNADFQNGDGAVDTVFFIFTAAVEFYEKQKLNLSGQQATLRTLREIP